jgi:putative transcriptional regulator
VEIDMRKELFEELAESVKQMKAIEAGEMEPARLTRADKLLQEGSVDVAALRARFKLSQSKFAALLGISVATLQNWEQKRREPEGPAKVLLRVAAAHPEALLSVTKTAPKRKRRRGGGVAV